MDGAWQGIIAYDIETTGLSPDEGAILTVVAFHGANFTRTINFLRDREHSFDAKRAEVISILNAAPRLTTFNGVQFDAPFLQKHLRIEPSVVGAWIAKTFDVFECVYRMLGFRCSLKEVLLANNLESKSGSGQEAVEWAKQPAMWPQLEAYCADDARLTYLLVGRGTPVLLPRRHKLRHLGDMHLELRQDGAFLLCATDAAHTLRPTHAEIKARRGKRCKFGSTVD